MESDETMIDVTEAPLLVLIVEEQGHARFDVSQSHVALVDRAHELVAVFVFESCLNEILAKTVSPFK